MSTNCAPLVADLFLFCYRALSGDKKADIIETFNATSRYLEYILNINNVFLSICPLELQLNKANTSDTEAAFLDLRLSISNDIVSTKIFDKRDDLILKLSILHF